MSSIVMLPPLIALKSSWFGSYLNYNADTDSEIKRGLNRFNGADVFSSLAKFEVVAANTGAGLVHIRCVYNKKFIRRRLEDDWHLSPEADEPEEDQSKWSCTLFEPHAVDDHPDKVRFMHVQSKRHATAVDHDSSGTRYWRLIHSLTDQANFDITDLESLVILPQHVAFKGDNGLYLRHADDQLRFISDNKGLSGSWFQVSTDGDANVEIKVFNSSESDNKYLWFDETDGDKRIIAHESPSKFRPVKIDANTLALQCLSNNKFCTRYSNLVDHSLSALDSSFSIDKWAHLTLEELVLSRRIYNTNFDLKNAIIYGEAPVTMATANASNNTSAENTVEIKFAYKDSKSSTWSSTNSWMVGMEIKTEFKIPFIGGAEVSVKGEYSGSYQWGETVTSESALEATYKVTVPAHTTLSVSLMATKGKCDVPYSYYQRDLLYNGKTVVYVKHDGLYTGANSYNFHYEVTPLKEPDVKADVTTRKKRSLDTSTERSLDTSTVPLKQQKIHVPLWFGLTSAQTKVITAAAPANGLS